MPESYLVWPITFYRPIASAAAVDAHARFAALTFKLTSDSKRLDAGRHHTCRRLNARESANMQRGSDPPEDIYSITVTSENLELLQNLFNDPGIDCGCRPAVTREARGYQTSVFAPQSRIEELRKRPGLDIEVHHNASEEGRRRQREAGTGDRFEQGRIVPRGFGRKA